MNIDQTSYSVPKITYETKHTAIAESTSREALLEWWLANKFNEPYNQLVADAVEEPNMCILRLKLEYKNQGRKITDIFQDALQDVPPANLVDFVLKNPDKTYEIAGRSYKILSLISDHGSYGDVFLAYDVETQSQVAIKILRHPEDMEHQMLERLADYGSHPNIVQYIGSSTLMDKTWIVMEYVKGESLFRYLNKSKWTAELEEQKKSALNFMWRAGVTTERENEKENILITSINGKPTVKLIDFGTLARG